MICSLSAVTQGSKSLTTVFQRYADYIFGLAQKVYHLGGLVAASMAIMVRSLPAYRFPCIDSSSQTYDWLLTLDGEIKSIWLSRWNFTKFLYVLTRYSSFLECAVVAIRE